MHAKPATSGHQLSAYLVNGAPHWIQVESECLSWWPVVGCSSQIDETNVLCNKQKIEFAQIIGIKPNLINGRSKGGDSDRVSIKQRIYSFGSDQSLNRSSSTISTVNEYPVRKNGEKILELKRQLAASRSSSSSFNIFDEENNNANKWPTDQASTLNKFKLYYAKRNDTKTTGRLVKVKKICIQPIKSKGKRIDVGKEGANNNSNCKSSDKSSAQLEAAATRGDTKQVNNKQPVNNNEKQQIATSKSCHSDLIKTQDESNSTTRANATTTTTPSLNYSGQATRPTSLHASGSAPPSCYTSEGSSSHLSSCSSSSPSPMQNLAYIGDEELIAPSINGQQSDSGISQTTTSGKSGSKKIKQHQRQQLQGDSGLLKLYEQIERNLKVKQRDRPKRLLIFVNPFGGKGKGLHVYKTQVRRLLDLAEIEVKLIVTNYANHARDTIEDPLFNIEYFDGIICVGGDGMFSELMNGVLFRYNQDKLLSFELSSLNKRLSDSGLVDGCTTELLPKTMDQSCSNDTNKITDDKRQQHLAALKSGLGGLGRPFKSPPLPIGVIGAGSTDCNSFGIIGTNDAISATLNIILGNQIHVDVCSIHSISDDRLLRFVSTFIAYGYFGDVIRKSEKLRWLGPSRYDVTGLNTLLRNRSYDGLVRIVRSPIDGSPMDQASKCHRNCSKCNSNRKQMRNIDTGDCHNCSLAEDQFNQLELIEQQGPFVGVNAAVMACRCPQTRKGFSPGNHLANGCADLILVRPCTRVQYINYLLRTGYSKKSAFDLRYVDAFRCRQFEFLAQNSTGNESFDPAHSATGDLHPNQPPYIDAKSSVSSSHCSDSLSSSGHSSKSNTLDAAATDNNASAENSFSSTETSGPKNDKHRNGLDGGSSWNADGEILTEQSIRVKVNNRLLRVFGTGEPQPL